MIEIMIPERAITKYNGRMTSRRGGIYLRPEVKSFEAACRYYTDKVFKGPVLITRLRVDIDFFFDNNRMPDLFNLPKAACDALNGVIWKDDRQIFAGTLRKANAGKNLLIIRVWEMSDAEVDNLKEKVELI